MMVNLGSGEEEDDRLFYYDDEKPAPQLPIGTPREGGEQRQDGERDLAGREAGARLSGASADVCGARGIKRGARIG